MSALHQRRSPTNPLTAIIQNYRAEFPDLGRWLVFRAPSAILQTSDPAGIPALLERIEEATARGVWAAGYLAYEAAPAFDPAFPRRPWTAAGAAPLCWFGLFERVDAVDVVEAVDRLGKAGPYRLTPWRPSVDLAAFTMRAQRIRELIAAGDTYQVNFTFPLRADFEGDPFALFRDLHRGQGAGHSAFVAAGDHAIASASPELFFAQAGDAVVTRPMKGTAPRGRWCAEDEARAAALAASEKERAENVMIVDLLRNDLGRIAHPGSVRAAPLFEIERYPSLLQMTSTVRARTSAHPVQILAALFPCGSITGAPKVRTMEIIAELEQAPRGVYTGAIGWIGPGRRACFNVAIRTVELRGIPPEGGTPQRLQATYGVGSGITWLSDPAAEYDECLLKARLLENVRDPGRARPCDFDLLETLRWDPVPAGADPAPGYLFLGEHLERLAASARYFNRPCDPAAIRAVLKDAAAKLAPHPHRVRLLLNDSGIPRLEIYDLDSAFRDASPVSTSDGSDQSDGSEGSIAWRIILATEPVNSRDSFLFHKTTRRIVYERARAARPGFDDVILFNERGELTESTLANIVVDPGDGVLRTPALDCGLLPGVFRERLLREGIIQEAVVPASLLQTPHRLWLINSVRGWIETQK